MDRNTVTGLVLILLVMVAWAYFTMPSQEELQKQKAEQARQDSIAAAQTDSVPSGQIQQSASTSTSPSPAQEQPESNQPQSMGVFSQASGRDTTQVTIETPLYKTTFTNVGAGPAKFILKNYDTWNQQPVQLIEDTTHSAYSLGFLSSENYNVETERLLFKQLTPEQTIGLQKDDTKQLKYVLNISDQKRLLYTYTFHGDSYQIDLGVEFQGLERNVIGSSVDFGWQSKLNFTEKDISQEGSHTSAYAYTGGELEQLQLSEAGQKEQNYNGTVAWVSTRTKFFTQIIKSVTPTEGARLEAELSGVTKDSLTDYHYTSFLTSKISDENAAQFELFIGPLAYKQLKTFDDHAYDVVNVGYSWIRWLSDPLVRHVIIPYFDFMGDFMNYGIAIVIFAIAVKLILYPLTKKSFESMAAMKELQPELKELQGKYKDNPQKQQEATMKLYKKAKVNPLGGCLPNLLQLPILVTLWRFFQNSILIRQQHFLWAHDLSAPDYIIHLPFAIPFLGHHIAGFVLLMTAAMFVQSNVTGGMGGPGGGAGGGQMAALKYIFPVMLLFIFNNFAAGLSLYYLIYNVVSILQQLLINKQIDQKKAVQEAG